MVKFSGLEACILYHIVIYVVFFEKLKIIYFSRPMYLVFGACEFLYSFGIGWHMPTPAISKWLVTNQYYNTSY